MNAIIKKAEARRRLKASSAGVDKGKAAVAEAIREEVPMVTIAEESEAPQLTSSRKRRAPETPRPTGQSASSGEAGSIRTEVLPIRQVRSDNYAQVIRCRSSLYEMYRDDLRIVGVGHTPLAGAVLRDVPSAADAEFISGLSWSELLTRSNSAMAEVSLFRCFLYAFCIGFY